MSKVFQQFAEAYDRSKPEVMTLLEFLDRAKTDRGCYASAAERMIIGIGEPTIIDTHGDPRMSRIFQNRTIKVYPAFSDFYGIEDVIEQIVGFFTHAAQGLEEKKQIVYELGPVGSSKSSIAERLKEIMEKQPIYVLADKDGNLSPCFESPLGLFTRFAADVEKEYGIPLRYLNVVLSPWATKRLDEYKHEITEFKVVKIYPSKLRQIAIAKTEPGDENNQDISSLVGKVDLRKLDQFSQNDPDAYSFSGGLCRANQGLLEFVEMFKAPIKTLNPLLTATQEGNYTGTEEIGAIPFQAVVLAHSNEAEWGSFKGNKNNEAFLDRIYVVKVPYCLRVDDEVKIYKKMIEHSSLRSAPIAPQTLEMMAQFSILTRLKEHANSNLFSKMKIYNGENLSDKEANVKTIQEYRDAAGQDEGMTGVSTRFAFKILSKVYNHDPEEVAADPVHLLLVLTEEIKRQQFGPQLEQTYLNFTREYLAKKYAEALGEEIQTNYLEAYGSYGQNIFERYVNYAEAWCDKEDYKDPDTGVLYNRDTLDEELQKIETPAGISNPKDFRDQIVRFVIKRKAENNGNFPVWTSYNKLADVIKKKMFAATEDLLPVISFTSKRTKEDEKKHHDFLERMMLKGYTEKMCRRLVEWWMRYQKAG